MRKKTKIAIIGCGWSGIGCAHVLLKNGYDIDIYEKLNDVGGTWHPDNGYANLKLHGLPAQTEFQGYDLPSDVDRCERISAQTVFKYLKNFCNDTQIYQKIQFQKKITAIHYDSNSKTVKLAFEHQKIKSKPYDYIIRTDGFTSRNLPAFDNQDHFEGQIIHHLDMDPDTLNRIMSKKLKVTVLGGSKSATDCIQNFINLQYDVKWLYRKPYYFLSYDYIKKIAQNRLQKRHFFKRYPHALLLGLLCSDISPKIPLWILFLTGKLKTFGSNHYDFNKCRLGLVDKMQLQLLRRYNQKNGIQSEIARLSKSHIILKNDQKIKSDVLICCTGSGVTEESLVNIFIDDQLQSPHQFHHAYHSQVLPEIPRVIFTAYNIMGAGVNGGLNHGAWAVKYIEAKHQIQFIRDHATYFKKPFLLNPALFDSDETIIKNIRDFWNMMFYNQELDMSKLEFLEWFFETFCSPYSARPVKFFDCDN